MVVCCGAADVRTEKKDHYINMLSTVIYLVRGEVDSSILSGSTS
jgi:hypothetical protein